MLKVYNLKGQSGRAVVNQFVLKDDNRKVFQSYDSTIVEVKWHTDFCEVNIGYYWDYSKTTSKYFKIFLMDEVGFTDEEVEQIKKELRKGHNYILVNRFIIHYCEDMR
jgi:hypothetical protein